jgi:hypothetical protein
VRPCDHAEAGLSSHRLSDRSPQRLAEILGDPVAVAAMVDRLVHHAEVIVLKGDSYRLRGKGEEVLSGSKERWDCSAFSRRFLLRFNTAVDSQRVEGRTIVTAPRDCGVAECYIPSSMEASRHGCGTDGRAVSCGSVRRQRG